MKQDRFINSHSSRCAWLSRFPDVASRCVMCDRALVYKGHVELGLDTCGQEVPFRTEAALCLHLTWCLVVTLHISYRSDQCRGMPLWVSSLLIVWLREAQRAHWFRQSAWQSARLRGLEYPPTPLLFLPLPPLSLCCNILLSDTGLYKNHIVQTLYLEALCKERETMTWKFFPFCWTWQEVRSKFGVHSGEFYYYTWKQAHHIGMNNIDLKHWQICLERHASAWMLAITVSSTRIALLIEFLFHCVCLVNWHWGEEKER